LNNFSLGRDALDVVAKVKYTPTRRPAVPVLEPLLEPERRYEMIGKPILLRNPTRKDKGAISKMETFQDIVDVWYGEIRNVAVAHSPILRDFSERSEPTQSGDVRTSGPLDTNVGLDAAACGRAVKEVARILRKVPLEFDEATVFDEDRHIINNLIRLVEAVAMRAIHLQRQFDHNKMDPLQERANMADTILTWASWTRVLGAFERDTTDS